MISAILKMNISGRYIFLLDLILYVFIMCNYVLKYYGMFREKKIGTCYQQHFEVDVSGIHINIQIFSYMFIYVYYLFIRMFENILIFWEPKIGTRNQHYFKVVFSGTWVLIYESDVYIYDYYVTYMPFREKKIGTTD